jgi:general secretion pathway protein D
MFRRGCYLLAWLAAVSSLACAQQMTPPDLTKLMWRAQELEERGETLLAWLAYSQIAGLDRANDLAAGKALQLRTSALAKATITSNASFPGDREVSEEMRIDDRELREARELLPPPTLNAKKTLVSMRLTADSKALTQRLFDQFGIEVIFDGDYDNRNDLRLVLDETDFEAAVYAWGLVTNSFVIPLSPKLALIVRDTDQKRREQERVVATTMPIPTAISSPEAQELARAIQQMFELQRVAIDTTRGTLLVRDRWSKVRLAEAALSQLLSLRGQVMIECELYEINEQSNLSFGFSLPRTSQLIPIIGNPKFIRPAVSGTFNAIGFGGGATLFGLGVTTANIFASMTHSRVSSLYVSQLRSLDGLSANLHIGDRFPIITAQIQTQFQNTPGQNVLASAPQIQFEDLGLTLKITPHVHGNRDVTMDVESEFKVLTGETNNDIPVIANRKYTGTVRLKDGEWAVAAGLITSNEARTLTGIAGLSSIPILGPALSSNGRDVRRGQTLLILRPRIIGASPAENSVRPIFTGSETRYYSPVSR